MFWHKSSWENLQTILIAGVVSLCATQSPAQGIFGDLFKVQTPPDTERPALWFEAVETLVSIYCVDLRCEAEMGKSDEVLELGLSDLEIPLGEFIEGTEATIFVENVSFKSSLEGDARLNGFPNNATLDLTGITVSDAAINEFTKAIFPDDPTTQRLVGREIAKEELSLRVAFNNEGGVAQIAIGAHLLSGDAIEAYLSVNLVDVVAAYLVSDDVSAAELADLGDPALQGAILFDSIGWKNLVNIPLNSAEVSLTEHSLLNKVFAPFLIDVRSEKERLFWENFAKLVAAVGQASVGFPSIDAKLEDIVGAIGFYQNWRSEGGNLVSGIRVPETNLATLDDVNIFHPETSETCSMEAVFVPLVVGGMGAALPYDQDFRDTMLNPEKFNFLLETFQNLGQEEAEDLDFVGEIFKAMSCEGAVLSLTYAAGRNE